MDMLITLRPEKEGGQMSPTLHIPCSATPEFRPHRTLCGQNLKIACNAAREMSHTEAHEAGTSEKSESRRASRG